MLSADEIKKAVVSTFEARNGAKPESHLHIVDDECRSLARYVKLLEEAEYGVISLQPEALEKLLQGALDSDTLVVVPKEFAEEQIKEAAGMLFCHAQFRGDAYTAETLVRRIIAIAITRALPSTGET